MHCEAYSSCFQVEKMASIVVKLIIDMWLQADPVESFALMLPMLRTVLAQQDPIYRVRAFDLVYNLSLHAQMIEPVGGSSEGATVVQAPRRTYRRMQPMIVNAADSARNMHGDMTGGYEVRTAPNIPLILCTCLLQIMSMKQQGFADAGIEFLHK
jgi:hypothetical protein